MSEQTIEQNDPAPIVAEPAEAFASQPARVPAPAVAIPFQVPAPIIAEMVAVEALSPAEMSQLRELEVTIEKGLSSWVEVGNALYTVREARLYRGEYPTFDAYLDERWGVSRSRAYQYMDASRVVHDLMGDPVLAQVAPTLKESQARELVSLKDPEQRREAAKNAIEAMAKGDLTAKGVREAVERVAGKTRTTPQAKARPEEKPKADKPGSEPPRVDKPKPEPPKADRPSPVARTGRLPTDRAEEPMTTVTGPEPAQGAATQPGEQYPPEEYPLTEAVRGLFRSPIPDSARNSVERLLASDPYKVSLGDADDLIRRCGLGRVEIVISVPQEPLATASA